MAHLLRVSGAAFSEGAAAEHDDLQCQYLARALGGDLPGHALEQAAAGVADGGLGYRRAVDLAAPAFVASRVEARPFVERLFASMASAGVVVPDAMQAYDAELAAALDAFCERLSPARAASAREACEAAAAGAAHLLQRLLAGRGVEGAAGEDAEPAEGPQLLREAGAEDDEHPLAGGRRRLQRSLAHLCDQGLLDHLAAAHARAGPEGEAHARRLVELRDETSSSAWLWGLDPRDGHSLEPDKYVAAVRLRLGAGYLPEPRLCRACGRCPLDPGGFHALCCAPGEGTRGHYDVRDSVLDLTRLADPTAETEVVGLFDAAPGLRPADILTSAASPGLTSALDVGVASPDAVGAGDDCLETMRLRKRNRYGAFLAELEDQGVEYRPLVWSCWGREHADTTAVLTRLARRAARRRGVPTSVLLRRARDSVGAALARRAAAMLLACAVGVNSPGGVHGPFAG